MKTLRFTDKELNFLVNVLKEQERIGLEYSNSFDFSEYEDMLMRLNMPSSDTKCYVVSFTHDNGVVEEDKRAICYAVDENDAFHIVKSVMEKSSYDLITLISVTEIEDSCVYVCNDYIRIE